MRLVAGCLALTVSASCADDAPGPDGPSVPDEAGDVATSDLESEGPGDSSGHESDDGDEMDSHCAASDIAVVPMPLRRLTPEQHAQAIADLFVGVDVSDIEVVSSPAAGALDHLAEQQHPSDLWTFQVHQRAVHAATRVAAEAETHLACEEGQSAHECLSGFVERLLPRAFRRPPSEDARDRYRTLVRELLGEFERDDALAYVVQAVLQDLEFLYLFETSQEGRIDGYALATRLSSLIWNTIPDRELVASAEAGELHDPATRREIAETMLEDPRAVAFVRNFARQVFELERIDATYLREGELPEFTPSLREDMRSEVERMVESVLMSPEGRFADLLLREHTEVSSELASLYGLEPPSEGQWHTVRLDEHRSGLLTTPGFLASHAVHLDPSPVRRGVFVLSRLLCRTPPPPLPGTDTSIPPDDVELRTNRERFEAHVADPACAGCHASIDGIGFGFEAYDVLGRHRETDNGFPVDDRGRVTLDGVAHSFRGAVELSHLLAESADVQGCMVRWWTSYALGRRLTPEDACLLDRLEAGFRASGGRVHELILDIIESPAFWAHVSPEEAAR